MSCRPTGPCPRRTCPPPVAPPAIRGAGAGGLGFPADERRAYRPMPRPPLPAAVRRRAEALRAWRPRASKEIGLEPGVLFPQRLIDRLAAAPPADLAGLRQVEGVHGWRVALLRPPVLEALAAASP